ncbi:MAG: pyridoxal phosphate-dependent aminotransferase [Planctomycetota bacterium]
MVAEHSAAGDKHSPDAARRISDTVQGFRPVPRTGVIYVMTEAARHGYTADSPDWANLGQGAPETGALPGGAARRHVIEIDDVDHEYTPVDGLPELREAIARLYNERYRVGKKSQYTADNVSICSGGRLALARVVSTLGRTNVGHFLPDYTAYEELLGTFGTFVAIPVMLSPDRGYEFTVGELEQEILGRGLSALLLSNPSNPTGKLIRGDALQSWIELARSVRCTVITDEFYSHYVYDGDTPVSAAAYVDDVDRDPVIVLDGVTKNWRYPGWRVSWTLGPKPVIQALASVGSFLDGGCAGAMQRAAAKVVTSEIADKEAASIRRAFAPKCEAMIDGLAKLGVEVNPAPAGSFYCWGNIEGLPDSVRTGRRLFEASLEEGLIVVPGHFFDINPGQRRSERPSRFRHYARFSFGPSMEVVERGLAKLGRVIDGAVR